MMSAVDRRNDYTEEEEKWERLRENARYARSALGAMVSHGK